MSTRISGGRRSEPPSRKPKNRYALFGGAAMVMGTVAVGIWLGGKAMIPDAAPVADMNPPTQGEEPVLTQPVKVPEAPEDKPLFSNSLLDAADSEEPEPVEESEVPELNVPFELEQVVGALSRLEIDENGDLVLNEQAQHVLEAAFMGTGETMDEQQLAQLKTLIETGLEGQAGNQAVAVAEKFYRYSNAFREISDTLGLHGDPKSLRQNFEQVARIRRTHLGPELAEQIYAEEEALTRYTLDVMAIQSNPDLSQEERARKQKELAEKSNLMAGEAEAQSRPESREVR